MSTATATKTPLLIQSWHEPDSCGGFNWALDAIENREHMLKESRRDAEDYRDVILIAVSLALPEGYTPNDVTEELDAELVFESGKVGTILYRSERWEDEA